MCLKFYAKHALAFNLLCKSFSEVYLSVLQAENCLTGTAYIHKRNAGASMVEINEGMSELLDKQV